MIFFLTPARFCMQCTPDIDFILNNFSVRRYINCQKKNLNVKKIRLPKKTFSIGESTDSQSCLIIKIEKSPPIRVCKTWRFSNMLKSYNLWAWKPSVYTLSGSPFLCWESGHFIQIPELVCSSAYKYFIHIFAENERIYDNTVKSKM